MADRRHELARWHGTEQTGLTERIAQLSHTRLTYLELYIS